MDIPVENADLFGTVFLLGRTSSHRSIVVKAESSYLVIVSMMTRRSHNREGLVNQSLRADACNSLYCATRRKRSSLISEPVHVRVNLARPNVLIPGQIFCIFFHMPQVQLLVREKQILIDGFFGVDSYQLLE